MDIKLVYLFLISSTIAAYGEIPKCSEAPANICGPNAECHDNKNDFLYKHHKGPYCQCSTGFSGKPPNCKVACKRDTDCKDHEYCDIYEGGDCIEGCRSDDSCKNNEVCNYSRKCEAHCSDHDQCSEDEFCSILRKCRKGCRSDEMCQSDEYCDIGGGCSKGCRVDGCKKEEFCEYFKRKCLNTEKYNNGCKQDDDCKTTEYCESQTRECLEGCRYEDSCKKGEYCNISIRKCAEGCDFNNHCNDDEICNQASHKCKKNCYKKSCGPNGKCISKNHIRYCSCIDGYVPVGGKGCEKGTNANLTCELACGSGSQCEIQGTSLYCFCELLADTNAIIDKCRFGSDAGPPGPPSKPTDENSISLQTAYILAG